MTERNDDARRRAQEALERAQSEQPILDKSMDRLTGIRKVFDLTTSTANAAEELLNAGSDIEETNDFLASIQHTYDRDHFGTLYILTKFGKNARLRKALLNLKQAVSQSTSNPKLDPKSHEMRKKYKDDKAWQDYYNRFHTLKYKVEVFDETVGAKLAGWMNEVFQPQLLREGSRFRNGTEFILGDQLIRLADDFQDANRERLRQRDFVDLADLIQLFVEQDREKSPTISISDLPHEVTVTKLLMETVLVKDLSAEDEKALPAVVRKNVAYGRPLMGMFRAFFDELPEAITDLEHPAHHTVIKMMKTLNSFQFDKELDLIETSDQPFNFQFSKSLAEKDIRGEFSFQDFILSINDLAAQPSKDQEWYQQFRDYLIRASHTFTQEVVYEADRAEEVIFTEPKTITEADTAKQLNEMCIAFQNPTVTISFDHEFENHLFDLNGSVYSLEVTARYVERGYFVINADVLVFQEERFEEDVQTLTSTGERPVDSSLKKFSYQVRFENGVPTVYFPVINQDQASDRLKKIALEQVKKAITVGHRDALDALSKRAQAKQQRPGSDLAPQKKMGDRRERMESYQPPNKEELAHTFIYTENKPNKSTSQRAEQDAVRRFLPPKLELSPGVIRKLEKKSKKGAAKDLFKATNDFMTDYNDAKGAKPGKAVQMTDVWGTNGETVWRFKTDYDVRILAVRMSRDHAVIVHVDDRDDIYEGGANNMKRKISQAVWSLGDK